MELKFDEVTVDTSLAEAYLREEEQLSQLPYNTTKSTLYFDGRNYTETKPAGPLPVSLEVLNLPIERKLRDLADKLKNHTNLFGQLQYRNQEIPIADTVAQINVIIQQIMYVAKTMKKEMRQYDSLACGGSLAGAGRPERIMSWDKSEPLLIFGLIPKVLLALEDVMISTDRFSAPVAHLFTKLCLEVGLSVGMRVVKGSMYAVKDQHSVKLLYGDAIGVVTELSDVDSAAEEFLMSTTCFSLVVPWKIQCIWVQQSVYQQFLDALKWKCDLHKNNCERGESTDKEAATFRFSDLTLRTDNAIPSKSSAVHVGAYATRRELLERLRAHCPDYLALWGSDVAEVNALVHAARATLAWVNGLADFRGPPFVSEAVYSHADWSSVVKHGIDYNELIDRKMSWRLLDFETRRDRLCNTLETFVSRNPAKKVFWDYIKNNLEKTDFTNFAHVGEDYVCYGFFSDRYDSTLFLQWILPSISGRFESIFHADLEMLTQLLVSVLIGNGFILPMSAECDESDEMFKSAGIPIAYSYDKDKCINNVFYSTPLPYVVHPCTRAIWMNSETT